MSYGLVFNTRQGDMESISNQSLPQKMLADILTKGLDIASFQKFRHAMGIKIPNLIP